MNDDKQTRSLSSRPCDLGSEDDMQLSDNSQEESSSEPQSYDKCSGVLHLRAGDKPNFSSMQAKWRGCQTTPCTKSSKDPTKNRLKRKSLNHLIKEQQKDHAGILTTDAYIKRPGKTSILYVSTRWGTVLELQSWSIFLGPGVAPLTVTSAAYPTGWGGTCGESSTGGLWSRSEKSVARSFLCFESFV